MIGHGLTKMRVHNLILNFVAFNIYIYVIHYCNFINYSWLSVCMSVCASVSPSVSFGTGRVGGFKMCIHIFNHLEQNMKVRCQGHSANFANNVGGTTI